MNECKTCRVRGVIGLTVDELPEGILDKLMWKAIEQITKQRGRKMNKCGTCRYNGVKGLIADEELHKGFLEKLSARDIAGLTGYYGCDFPNYDCAILFGGPEELLSYSMIVDLADPSKSYSPFETAQGRVLSDFAFCFGTVNGYLENITDLKMQTMVAMGRLIDISREMNNGNGGNGKIAMLTYKENKGCCPFHEGELEFNLTYTLNHLAKRDL